MLAVNGKPLDFTSMDEKGVLLDPIAKKVANEYKNLIKNHKFPVKIKYHPAMYRLNIDNPNRPHCPASYPIHPQATAIGENGAPQVWTYYEIARPREDGRGFDFLPSWIDFRGTLLITEDKVDLLYFLKYLSFQNISNTKSKRRKSFIIEDKAAEARNKLNLTTVISRVEFLITNDPRDGGMGDEKVRSLAKAYDIREVEDKQIEEVRVELIDILKLKHKAVPGDNIYDRFLLDANMGLAVQAKVAVVNARDNKIIGLQKKGTSRTWCYMEMSSKNVPMYGQAIIQVLSGKNEEQALIDYLSTNETEFENLKKRLEELDKSKVEVV
jgi:hypothetical protein